MRYIFLSLILINFISCLNNSESDSGDRPETEWASQEPKPIALVEVTNFKTKSGIGFTVVEKKLSASMSRITVQGTGFPNSQEVFTLKDVDPMQTGLQADLDGDGFEEIYLVLRSAGSGSHATIYGFVSYKDKSYGQIYIPEPAENDANFKGYMGHDRISILGNRLIREFPVFNAGDPNSSPSGGTRVLRYALEAGETSYILTVKEVSSPN
jgi:hypothetical protein